jgi:K+-transporting ATPase A subunit
MLFLLFRAIASGAAFLSVIIIYRPISVAGILVSISLGLLMAAVFNILVKLSFEVIPNMLLEKESRGQSKCAMRINDTLFVVSMIMVPILVILSGYIPILITVFLLPYLPK